MYDLILDAGWDLLLSKGFEKFSIDRLARFARVGKPTIYARFENKEDLLRKILVKRIEWQQESIFSSIDPSSLSAAIPVLAAEAVSVFQSAEVRLIDRLIDWIDYEADKQSHSLRGWTAQTTISILEQHIIEANALGETHIPDPKATATFLIEGIAGHARLSDTRLPQAHSAHLAWAHDYWQLLQSSPDKKAAN
ncbi:TetR/AcrR family transcriptional regulator [Pontixanthobacter aquaemixtae]|uniref:TetR family transcriptional regulator n=1 Tax=Pontixanthobacter aquaemixtae TaxID=1958940 RepID=A0A844ZU82_9SPHN|nr:TetR/AcrR family transcriptional regulator [Pontixanthobacter aquaemixtae]MXO91034.1 TetR family transcriptional regulator [Pontixanthobacter aquaemixtae]